MKIGISSKAIFLAAGEQTRFGPGKPKCLYEISGEPILARLIRQLELEAIIVISDAWEQEYTDIVKRMGDVVTVSTGLSCGHSLATGLRACQSTHEALIVNADTVIPTLSGMPVPRGWGWALFDPWEWFVLYILRTTEAVANHCETHCRDKVEYMWQVRMPLDVFRSGWVNVNTQEDLERARKLCQSTQ